MFMAPLADQRSWNPRGISGCRRFLERSWRLLVDPDGSEPVRPELAGTGAARSREVPALELERALNRMLRRIDESFAEFNFNTAVAAMMIFLNEASDRPGALTRDQAERFVRALSPFAPHVAEELWHRLGHRESVSRAAWPEADPAYLEDETFELVVQVVGKVRGKVTAPSGAGEKELEALARGAVLKWLEGKTIVKVVVVPGRLVNFVVR
jgi:leucyl-tRNA synthetase